MDNATDTDMDGDSDADVNLRELYEQLSAEKQESMMRFYEVVFYFVNLAVFAFSMVACVLVFALSYCWIWSFWMQTKLLKLVADLLHVVYEEPLTPRNIALRRDQGDLREQEGEPASSSEDASNSDIVDDVSLREMRFTEKNNFNTNGFPAASRPENSHRPTLGQMRNDQAASLNREGRKQNRRPGAFSTQLSAHSFINIDKEELPRENGYVGGQKILELVRGQDYSRPYSQDLSIETTVPLDFSRTVNSMDDVKGTPYETSPYSIQSDYSAATDDIRCASAVKITSFPPGLSNGAQRFSANGIKKRCVPPHFVKRNNGSPVPIVRLPGHNQSNQSSPKKSPSENSVGYHHADLLELDMW